MANIIPSPLLSDVNKNIVDEQVIASNPIPMAGPSLDGQAPAIQPLPLVPSTLPAVNPNILPADQMQVIPTQPVAAPIVVQPAGPDMSAYNKMDREVNNIKAIGTKAAVEENIIADGYVQEQNRFAKEQDDLLNKRYEEVEKKQLAAQAIIDQVANQTIDPNRVFSSMSTGERIGTFLMAFMSGDYGTARINRMIDQDVNAQISMRDNKLGAAKSTVTMYSQLLDQFKDHQTARAALRASQYQAMQVKLNALGATTRNADFQMKTVNMSNELEKEKQNTLLDFSKRQQLLQAANITPETTINEIQDEKTRERFVPGLGLAATKEDAAKLKDEGAVVFQALENIKALKGYIGLGSKISPSQKAEVESEIGTLVGAMKIPIVGTGAFSDSEREFVKGLIGDPSQLFSLNTSVKAKLAKLEAILVRSRNVKAKAYGLTPPKNTSDLINSKRVK